jgi:glycosyltransferase involved in cell wall biosynthesis
MTSPQKPLQVLWLAREIIESANSGDRIYTYELAAALARSGAQVHFLGLAQNGEIIPNSAPQPQEGLVCERIPGPPRNAILSMFSLRPLISQRIGTKAYRQRLTQLLNSQTYDAVVLDQYGLSWALPILAAKTDKSRTPLVYVAHDFETQVTLDIARASKASLPMRMALRLNAVRTAWAERELAKDCGLIVTLTQSDADLFSQLGECQRFEVLPPGYRGIRSETREIDARVPRRVVIMGSFRWMAKRINLNAMLEVADEIFHKAGIELIVVGDCPEDLLEQWQGRLSATRFLGFVDDLDEALRGCRMGLVVEAVGGGFKLKVLDYAFTRTPVVALKASLGGQDSELTRHMGVVEDLESLVRMVVAWIDDFPRLNAMQEGAFSAVANRYDWDTNGLKFVKAITSLHP